MCAQRSDHRCTNIVLEEVFNVAFLFNDPLVSFKEYRVGQGVKVRCKNANDIAHSRDRGAGRIVNILDPQAVGEKGARE